MTLNKRVLQLENMRDCLSKTVQGCKYSYDNPRISRIFKKVYGYTLGDRIRTPLTNLSGRIDVYLSGRFEKIRSNAKADYELICLSIRMWL
jgi:hypothetical protein